MEKLIGLNNRGLTVAELLVSLAVSMIGVLVAITTTLDGLILSGKATLREELSTDFIFISHFFSRETTTGGGVGLPIESAFFVENNCKTRLDLPDCGGTDRMTIANSEEGGACSVTAYDPSTPQFVDGFIHPTQGCCFTMPGRNYNGRHIMLVLGGHYAQRWVQSVDAATCRITIVNGPMSDHDNVIPAINWTGGEVVPIRVATFFIDKTTNELKRFRYEKFMPGTVDKWIPAASANGGEEEILSDRFFDLQVSLGFDFLPSDGELTDNQNTTDEWLYNAPGIGESRAGPLFSAASGENFKMIAIGIAIGGPSLGTQSTVQLLDGSSSLFQNWQVRGEVFKFALKNTNIFTF